MIIFNTIYIRRFRERILSHYHIFSLCECNDILSFCVMFEFVLEIILFLFPPSCQIISFLKEIFSFKFTQNYCKSWEILQSKAVTICLTGAWGHNKPSSYVLNLFSMNFTTFLKINQFHSVNWMLTDRSQKLTTSKSYVIQSLFIIFQSTKWQGLI